MPRRAVRQLQQLLAEEGLLGRVQPQHEQHERRGQQEHRPRNRSPQHSHQREQQRQPQANHPNQPQWQRQPPQPQPHHHRQRQKSPQPLSRRRGGPAAVANPQDGCEDGLLLFCHRLQRSRIALGLAALLLAGVLFATLGGEDRGDEASDNSRRVRVSRNDPAAEVLEKALKMKKYAERTNSLIKDGGRGKLSMRQSTLDHLQTLPDFPKIVHLVWPDKHVLSKDFQVIQHGAAKLKKNNPTWRFLVHNYKDVDDALRNFRHPEMPPSFHDDLQRAHIVEKTDAFRLVMVYARGGLYVDIDRVMNVDLDEVIDVKKVKMVSPTHYDVNFACDLFGSAPGNDVILRALKRQSEARAGMERRDGWIQPEDQMRLVKIFTESMEEEFFGRRWGSGSPLWDEARRVLSKQSGGTIVTKKDVWCDGLLVKYYDGCKEVSRDSLYEAYGVGEWSDKVKEVWKDEEG